MRVWLVSAVAIAAVHLVALAQTQTQTQPPPQTPAEQQPPPIFRAGAALVRVDVTVTNRRGEPATDLAATDFEVSEDGVPQTVETFKLVSADGRQAKGDDTSLEIRSPEHAAAEAARDDVRVFLIFWDEYHIGRMVSAIQGRKALTDFVTSAFGPTDLVALMNPLLPTDAIRWTRNRTDLSQAIQKLEGRYRVYMPTRSVLEEGQLFRRDVERVRSEVTLSALQSAASYLGSIREGRKAIVFVSEGLPSLDPGTETNQLQDLIRAANDNNTAIYTLDPRGLGAGVADELWVIAANTGASAIVNTNDPSRALRQVVVDASAFYLLGYASAKNPSDGKFHEIKVKVKRPGLDVRARKGYWAPSTTDLDRAARATANAVPAEIAGAIATLTTPRPQGVLDLWTGSSRAADGSPAVTISWRTRPGRAVDPKGRLFVTAHMRDDLETFNTPLASQMITFPVPGGVVQLKLVVSDERGDVVDEDTLQVTVPDLEQVRLALSSPAVILAKNALELKSVGTARVPFAGREYSRTDRMFVRFAVYGAAAGDATVTARLLSRTGSELRMLTIAPPRAGLDAYEIDVPLASLARGDFVIAIAAEAGDDHAGALVPLRVIS